MKKTMAFLALFCVCGASYGQKGKITGLVQDVTTGEPLIGATVLIGPGVGTVTDLSGNFSIEADYGDYSLAVSFVGFESFTQEIKLDRKLLVLKPAKLGTTTLTEVQVVADVARDRETPVAFTNVLPAQIEEELASQDIPMILNSTPGVYATQSGGGDGDARITIRGFSQRNIAVMIDGIPVNDMENGWVYWSNWFGLDAVTRTIQVQRGLGASKIALPSVGGTMNILTKGIDNAKSATIKQEVGVNGYTRTSLGITTGKMKNGFGITAAGSFKQGNGYVDQTFTKGYFYYLKAEKFLGKHLLSISAMGAPQSHGQRSYKIPIASYSNGYARDLFEGSDEAYQIMVDNNQGVIDDQSMYDQLAGIGIDKVAAENLASNFVDTIGGLDMGFKYNQHWGMLERRDVDANGDTIPGNEEVLHEKVNYYHKPQFIVKDFWTVNDKLTVSNMAYLSIGNGGGTSASKTIQGADGQLVWQGIYDANVFGTNLYSPIVPNYHTTERKATNIMRSSVNNHFWYGLLSVLSYQKNNYVKISGGLDLRSYKGEHYREVYDLLGGDYYVSLDDETSSQLQDYPTQIKRVGDKIAYNNDSYVNWGGIFGQVEYKKDNWSMFMSSSAMYSGYKRIDYFARKDLVLGDEVLEQALPYGGTLYHDGTNYITATPGATVYTSGDTVFVNNVGPNGPVSIINPISYTVDSEEARYATRDWLWKPGVTVKAGANYNLNEFHNVFMNMGYISKTPRFQNVIDFSNEYLENIKNEIITAVEIGYALRNAKSAVNVNAYVTKWKNKPETTYVADGDGGQVQFNIQGMEALHIGVETDAAFKIHPDFQIEGLISFGEWKWMSGDSGIVYDDNLDSIAFLDFDATGVHVGDAAQTQIAISARYELKNKLWLPKNRIYLKPRLTYFTRHYADFNPYTLQGNDKRTESWLMPSYYLLDIHSGYGFNMKDVRLDIRFSLLNALDHVYISDATNGGYFNAGTSNVFFGLGRRYNLSLKITI
jgi:hypothetical protein